VTAAATPANIRAPGVDVRAPAVVLKEGQELVQKGRYAAVVDVPFLLAPVISAPLIRSELEAKGFKNVRVSEDRPAGFPLQGGGDYYVTVDWTNLPQVFDVPGAVTEYRKVA
jgi:hypothetical protein